MHFLNLPILSIEGGSSRSHYVEESFWKRLWTCRFDRLLMMMMIIIIIIIILSTGKWGSCFVKYFSLEKGSTGAKVRNELLWYTAD